MHDNLYIKYIKVTDLLHLNGIEINIPENENDRGFHNLILTGKNGSGKTSLLKAIAKRTDNVVSNDDYIWYPKYISNEEEWLKKYGGSPEAKIHLSNLENNIKTYKSLQCGIEINYSKSEEELRDLFEEGEFALAYLQDLRYFNPEVPHYIENTELKEKYNAFEKPNTDFIKYIVGLKVDEALYKDEGQLREANEISHWFDAFQNSLRLLFSDSTINLKFDVKSKNFNILQKGRKPYDFTQLSSGYAAVLDILLDIILRMQKLAGQLFSYESRGIVFIDEIETHLHLELQRKIMGFLCNMFPNVQFIVTTHSPFILNSTPNAVAFDLERKQLITDGLCDLSYSGIVDGYFNVEEKSQELVEKYKQYVELTMKDKPSDEDYSEIARLEQSLDEIPDYLMSAFTADYSKRKLEFWNKQ